MARRHSGFRVRSLIHPAWLDRFVKKAPRLIRRQGENGLQDEKLDALLAMREDLKGMTEKREERMERGEGGS